MIEIITGDLLDATEKYICHQTNCLSTGQAAGIARAIFDRFPYADCYTNPQEKRIPGTIDIRGDGSDNRYIVNMNGQVYPGGSGYGIDGKETRAEYFWQALHILADIPNLESVAFPFRIGCAIAGGDWQHYFSMIELFAKEIKETQNAKTTIYKLSER